MIEQTPLERASKALVRSLNVRPYGGYDYGHNEAFYGPAPEAGRYVVRCEKTNKIVHQTNDQAAHDAAYEHLTSLFHVRAVLEAIREPSAKMIEAGYLARDLYPTAHCDTRAELARSFAEPRWQEMIDAALDERN